jgi:hypothetical protein
MLGAFPKSRILFTGKKFRIRLAQRRAKAQRCMEKGR